MAKSDPQYHSTYKDYDIYFREGIKRRPWVILLHPEKLRGKYAAVRSLEAAQNIIDRKIRHDENLKGGDAHAIDR